MLNVMMAMEKYQFEFKFKRKTGILVDCIQKMFGFSGLLGNIISMVYKYIRYDRAQEI